MNRSTSSRGIRLTSVVCVAFAVTLSMSGCKSGSSSASADKAQASAAVQSLQSNKDVQAAQTKYQQRVQDCLKANPKLTSKAGRQAFLDCVVPATEKASAKACAKTALINAIPYTKAKRDQLENVELPKCLNGAS